jgi:hypothetical protein
MNVWNRWAGAMAMLFHMHCFAESAAVSPTWTLTGRINHHNDAVALQWLGDDDRVARALRPKSGRNMAYVDDEIRLARTHGAWTWSLLNRAYAQLAVNDDALDVFARIQLGEEPATNRSWKPVGHYKSFQGKGLSIRYQNKVVNPWFLEAEGLSLTRFRNFDFSGALDYQALQQNFSFIVNSEVSDSQHIFPFMAPVSSSGVAVLLHAGWTAEYDHWRFEASFRDFGFLNWSGIPMQFQAINSATRTYDQNGYLLYKPLVAGRYEQDRSLSVLPGRWQVAGRLQVPGEAQDWGLGFQTLQGFGFLPWLESGRTNGWGRWGVRWDAYQKRMTFSLDRSGWRLGVGSDQLSRDAKSVFIQIMGSMAF